MYTFNMIPPPESHPPGYEPDRITVWKQTQEKYKDTPPPPPSTKYTEYLEAYIPKNNTAYVFPNPPTKNIPPTDVSKRYPSTTIRIINRDMIDEAVELKNSGAAASPLILNMADWRYAGGCVDAGSGAQEEECFRRSNYFRTLLQSFYPLEPLDTIISPQVEYYRRGAGVGYIYMDEPVKIDMIAAPAVCFPQTSRDRKFMTDEKDVKLLEAKIDMLFRVAAANKNDVLILSAWGCGAFGCPPYHIAKIFKKVCAEYDGAFKEIVFAILGTNYRLFKDSWEETVE